MNHLYKRKLFIIMLFIFILFRTLNLHYYSSPKSLSKEKPSRLLFIKYATNTAPVLFQNLHLDFNMGTNLNLNGILIVFVTWKFILASPLVLKPLIIDTRKRIIELLTSYFEGGKYKVSFFFSLKVF